MIFEKYKMYFTSTKFQVIINGHGQNLMFVGQQYSFNWIFLKKRAENYNETFRVKIEKKLYHIS